MYERFKFIADKLQSLGVTQEGKIFLTQGTRNLPIGWLKPLKCGSFLYEKEVQVRNLFKKLNAWGINYHVLSNLGNNGYIRLYSDDNRIYEISKREALAVGKFFYFKNQGFEKQLFIPIQFWRVLR